MQLPKSSKLMTDQELCDWVIALIKRKAPESDYLDYKEWSRMDRKEFAKDISSFANERGGLIVHGVPEEKNDIPIPKDLTDCGIDKLDVAPIDLENILLDTVRPSLPEIDIRILKPAELHPKVLLLVCHPASWARPHMVEGYAQGRYYRRGNYRAVLMKELDVEAAYQTRQMRIIEAGRFFETARMPKLPGGTDPFARISICPATTVTRRQEFHELEFKTWVENNPPAGRRVYPVPFVDGIRYISHSIGALDGREFELRLFHNGALSFTLDCKHLTVDKYIKLDSLVDVVKDSVFQLAIKAFEFLSIQGPLLIEVRLLKMEKFRAHIVDTDGPWYRDPNLGESPLAEADLSFIEESSTNELQESSDAVLRRLEDRLYASFGYWRR
jgi:hypothetical protein